MSAKRATLRTHRIIRTIASSVIIACVFVALRFVNFSVLFDTVTANGYEPSVDLAEIAKNIRLTRAGERILRGTRAELQNAESFNESCKSYNDQTIILGCYSNNHIYVYDVSDRDLRGVLEATLAHELLHAVWTRMSASEQDAIKPSLQKMYDANEELREHLKLYRSTEFYDELHSIVGSQIPNEQLSEDLRIHFAKYFMDQNLIANYYHKYSDKLLSTEKRIRELEELIEQLKTEITTREVKYNSENEQLSIDIANFNSRVSNGLLTREEYETERAKLVERQEWMMTEYTALRAKEVDYNAYITEYNQFVVFTQKVYNSLNSNAKKPATN